jgi:hypothetical protein
MTRRFWPTELPANIGTKNPNPTAAEIDAWMRFTR